VSACRQLFGGCVACEIRQSVDESDSYEVEAALASQWPDMKAIIPLVCAPKVVCSTAGMQAIV